MYHDIGKKIMGYMKTICVIAIVCTVISMIIDIVSIASMHYSQLIAKYGTNDPAAPILSSIFSHFLTAAGIYVGSWVLYAFGQLVDDIHAMRTNNTQKPMTVRTQQRDAAVSAPIQKSERAIPVQADRETRDDETAAKIEEREERTENRSLDENNWKCSCGRTNPYYIVTCACGQKQEKTENAESNVKSVYDPPTQPVRIVGEIPHMETVPKKKSEQGWKCSKCGTENSVLSIICMKCGNLK